MREHREFDAICIIVLSSSSIEKDVEKAYATGANGYLIKPPLEADLLAALNLDRASHWPVDGDADGKFWGWTLNDAPAFASRSGDFNVSELAGAGLFAQAAGGSQPDHSGGTRGWI